MIFKDEKPMWHADTEILAAKLANKEIHDIMEILDDNDVITLKTGDKPTVSMIGRLLSIIVYPLVFVLFSLKWIITGDGHLDSWIKKIKILDKIIKYCGIA